MSAKFYTILTETGKAKLANAAALGRQVKLTNLAVGDGNGVEYDPVETQESLKNETYRTPVSHLGTDAQNKNWVIAEGMVPVDVGGWFVREVGVFDEDGDLFAIGKYPETYKPILSEGTGRDLYIRFIMVVSNTSAIDLKIDPTVAIATKNWVGDNYRGNNDEIESQFIVLGEQNIGDTVDVSLSHAMTSVKKIKAIAVSETSSLNESYNFSRFNNEVWSASSDINKNGAWVAETTGSESISLSLPFGVVIGDSIAEGHPELHGRLHTAAGIVDLNHPNESGQLSYELGELTGIHWYNHGIGGQVTSQILQRWRRDALGEVFDAGDGKGTKTLPGKPAFIVVNVGINNVSYGQGTAGAKSDILEMVKSCRDNKIMAVFNTPPSYKTSDQERQSEIQDLRLWMLTELPRFGVWVFDAWEWSRLPNSNNPNPLLITDSVHPSPVGYKSMARSISEQTQIPWCLESITLDTSLDPKATPTKYARPIEYTLSLGEQTITTYANAKKEIHSIPLNFSVSNEKELSITITKFEEITGNEYSGICGAHWCFSKFQTNQSMLDQSMFGKFGVVASGILSYQVNGWFFENHGEPYGINWVVGEPESLLIKFENPVNSLIVKEIGMEETRTVRTSLVVGNPYHWRIYLYDNQGNKLSPALVRDMYVSIMAS